MNESARIVARRAATAAEWLAAHRADAAATFFQGPEWAAAWEAATAGAIRPDAQRVEFDDGRSAILVLCWRRRVGGLLRTALSSPGETYGGWISASPLDGMHARALLHELRTFAGNLRWKLNPFDPSTRGLSAPDARADETLVLDLQPGFEELRHAWTRGHRSGANKAQRCGVRVRLAQDERDWEAYAAAVAETHQRWGAGAEVIVYPPRLLRELARHGGDQVELWLAELGGQVVAGAMLLRARHHVAYWHAAARTASLDLRPMNLLLQEALRAACARPALRWFDFGSSGPLTGVAAFKRSFGARPLSCPTLSVETGLRRCLRRAAVATRRVLGGPRTPSRHASPAAGDCGAVPSDERDDGQVVGAASGAASSTSSSRKLSP